MLAYIMEVCAVDIMRVKKRGAVIASGITVLTIRLGVGPMLSAFGK